MASTWFGKQFTGFVGWVYLIWKLVHWFWFAFACINAGICLGFLCWNLCRLCFGIRFIGMRNSPFILKETPLGHILDKWAKPSHEPMSKTWYTIVTGKMWTWYMLGSKESPCMALVVRSVLQKSRGKRFDSICRGIYAMASGGRVVGEFPPSVQQFERKARKPVLQGKREKVRVGTCYFKTQPLQSIQLPRSQAGDSGTCSNCPPPCHQHIHHLLFPLPVEIK